MAKTPVSTALIGLFNGMTAVKKNRFGEASHGGFLVPAERKIRREELGDWIDTLSL
jgi:hypothetical protein